MVSLKSKQGLLGKMDHSESRELSQITHVQDDGKIQSSLLPHEEAANKISKEIIKPKDTSPMGEGASCDSAEKGVSSFLSRLTPQ